MYCRVERSAANHPRHLPTSEQAKDDIVEQRVTASAGDPREVVAGQLPGGRRLLLGQRDRPQPGLAPHLV